MKLSTKFFAALTATVICGPGFAQDSSSYYTKGYQQEALEIYRHIISVRSAAGHGKIPELTDYLANVFREGGFDDADIHVLPQTLSTGEDAAALVVRYRGNDASGEKPILLLAHMDVVDAIRSDWERDPYTLIEEDGFFFGRGTLDNKFGIATLTSTFLQLKDEGFVPTRDLIIGFTGDEETLMETTRALAYDHRELTDAAYVLNADGGGGALDNDNNPMAYRIQAAEKSYASFELTIRNPGGHSSRPRKDNAIYELATALKNVEAHTFRPMINDVTQGFFEAMSGVSPEPVRSAMRAFVADPEDPAAAAVLTSVPSLVGLTRTTCVATMLRGGHAENALPQSATATVNCRIFPDMPVDEVQQTLFDAAGNPTLEISLMAEPTISPVSELIEEVTAAVGDSVRVNYGDVPLIPSMAAYGTDGAHMRQAGMPTYGVSGLFIKPGDIFAHGLNERVPVKSFYIALDYWPQLLKTLAGQP